VHQSLLVCDRCGVHFHAGGANVADRDDWGTTEFSCPLCVVGLSELAVNVDERRKLIMCGDRAGEYARAVPSMALPADELRSGPDRRVPQRQEAAPGAEQGACEVPRVSGVVVCES
jgi:hypothetical protein